MRVLDRRPDASPDDLDMTFALVDEPNAPRRLGLGIPLFVCRGASSRRWAAASGRVPREDGGAELGFALQPYRLTGRRRPDARGAPASGAHARGVPPEAPLQQPDHRPLLRRRRAGRRRARRPRPRRAARVRSRGSRYASTTTGWTYDRRQTAAVLPSWSAVSRIAGDDVPLRLAWRSRARRARGAPGTRGRSPPRSGSPSR